MFSFTVCWVIPREQRGRKTSRDSDPRPKKPHIYIFFLSSLQAQSNNAGDGRLVSRSPSPHRLPPHTGTRLRLQDRGGGIRAPTALPGFGIGVRRRWHPKNHRPPRGRARGSSDSSAVLSSDSPRPGARGQTPGQAGTSGATTNGTSVPIKTHHYVKIHIEIWIDRLDKNGS